MLLVEVANLLLILIIAISTTDGSTVARRQARDNCLTSAGSDGVCLPLKECQSEAQSIGSRRRPTVCRWETFGPVICCPTSNGTAIPLTNAPKCGISQLSTKRSIRQVPLSGEISNSSGTGEFVMGGTDAELGKWPWMALLFVDDDANRRSPLCGGTLISETMVLTAAHCFNGLNDAKIVVRLGLHFVKTSATDNLQEVSFKEVRVQRIIKHESYQSPAIYNDIALLKLESKVTLSDRIQIVCLPNGAIIKDDFVGKKSTVTGFGQKEFGGAFANILQEVELSVFSNADCDKKYKSLSGSSSNLPKGVTEVVVCAGSITEAKDACGGDSGGPLVTQSPTQNWILIGVVSAGYKCGELFPGLYTRVTKYIDWIESNSA